MATSWIGHITVQCLVHCTVIALKMSVIEGVILGVMSTAIGVFACNMIQYTYSSQMCSN